MFEDLLLARGTAQYYALEQLFRYAPPAQSYWRERPYRAPRQRVRKALRWTWATLSRSAA
jgi:hypothetical protein